MDKYREDVALWRLRLIAPLLAEHLTASERGALRRQLAARSWPHPDGSIVQVSAETLRHWCRLYRKDGFAALHPRDRSDQGKPRAFTDEVLVAAARLKREVPQRSVQTLIALLESQQLVEPGALRRSTLRRHLAAMGLSARVTRTQTIHRRFETERPGDLWQTDEAHFRFSTHSGQRIAEHLFFFIDDHSRLVPHAAFYPDGRLDSLAHALKLAIRKHGAPRAIYADNGKVFIADALARACAQLGIRLLHTGAYQPESKGKAERWIRTVRDALYPELEDALYASTEERNAALSAWIAEVYHRREHSETGATPLARYLADPPRRPTEEELYQAFLHRCRRQVSKVCTLSLNGHIYEVPPILARQTVELRYDADDPERVVAVFLDDNFMGRAKPTRPAKWVPRRLQGPAAAVSSRAGRNYLDELQKRHHEHSLPPAFEIAPAPIDDGRLSLAAFLDALRRRRMAISPEDERTAATFFEEHGPFDAERALVALEQALQRKGHRQHLSYYLDAIATALLAPKDQR